MKDRLKKAIRSPLFWVVATVVTLMALDACVSNADTEWKAATWTYAIGSGLDIYTTDIGLNTGNAHETNPLLGQHPSDAKIYSAGIVLSAGAWYGLKRVKKHNPRLAKVMLWVFGGYRLYLAHHNYQVYRDVR